MNWTSYDLTMGSVSFILRIAMRMEEIHSRIAGMDNTNWNLVEAFDVCDYYWLRFVKIGEWMIEKHFRMLDEINNNNKTNHKPKKGSPSKQKNRKIITKIKRNKKMNDRIVIQVQWYRWNLLQFTVFWLYTTKKMKKKKKPESQKWILCLMKDWDVFFIHYFIELMWMKNRKR